MIGTAVPITIIYEPTNGQVQVVDEQGDTLVNEAFDGDVDKVLEFVDECGITHLPSFKLLDKYAAPSHEGDEKVVWEQVPVEFDENEEML